MPEPSKSPCASVLFRLHHVYVLVTAHSLTDYLVTGIWICSASPHGPSLPRNACAHQSPHRASFAQEADGTYRLTPVSSLLVSDDGTSNRKSHVQMVLLELSPFIATPVMNMAEWFKRDEETAFKMTHGADFWGVCGRDVEFGMFFNDAMASESRFIMDAAIHGAGQLFEGITSLVDVAGSTGAAARALAAAFPHIKCTVLDLPQVINDIPADGPVEFVAGNMMDFIPQADALLLKFVLHDWSDMDCVNILKRCKDAIPSREAR